MVSPNRRAVNDCLFDGDTSTWLFCNTIFESDQSTTSHGHLFDPYETSYSTCIRFDIRLPPCTIDLILEYRDLGKDQMELQLQMLRQQEI
ncbi:hypothetical protein V6N11_030438 [Hibiscus sabdariffa]|uniref:Uncharacterized protein n=1 Tax=Hibiscus sabdariffa TaxID=183260 RepID=A0ABR2PLL8_9ROSI